jgi:hypothetical protein
LYDLSISISISISLSILFQKQPRTPIHFIFKKIRWIIKDNDEDDEVSTK